MSEYTVTIAPMDLTHWHIGQRARYSALTPDGYVAHEGMVNDISFGEEHVVTWDHTIVQDITTAEVRIDDEWHPLTHVRFAETNTPWGKGNQ